MPYDPAVLSREIARTFVRASLPFPIIVLELLRRTRPTSYVDDAWNAT